MICLKNLSREFNLDPYKLRGILRKEFGHAKGKRWQWPDDKDPDLKKVRAFLSKFSEKSTTT